MKVFLHLFFLLRLSLIGIGEANKKIACYTRFTRVVVKFVPLEHCSLRSSCPKPSVLCNSYNNSILFHTYFTSKLEKSHYIVKITSPFFSVVTAVAIVFYIEYFSTFHLSMSNEENGLSYLHNLIYWSRIYNKTSLDRSGWLKPHVSTIFSHTRSLSLFFFCWSFYNITIQLQYPSTYYRNFLHHFWKRGVGCGVSFTRFVLIYFLKTRNALISTHTTRREKLAYLSHITHF
jgi:hypothetical protein